MTTATVLPTLVVSEWKKSDEYKAILGKLEELGVVPPDDYPSLLSMHLVAVKERNQAEARYKELQALKAKYAELRSLVSDIKKFDIENHRFDLPLNLRRRIQCAIGD